MHVISREESELASQRVSFDGRCRASHQPLWQFATQNEPDKRERLDNDNDMRLNKLSKT